jgi:hypothetical protein
VSCRSRLCVAGARGAGLFFLFLHTRTRAGGWTEWERALDATASMKLLLNDPVLAAFGHCTVSAPVSSGRMMTTLPGA